MDRLTRTALAERLVAEVLAAKDPAALERALLSAAVAAGAGAAAVWRDDGAGLRPCRERGPAELLPARERVERALAEPGAALAPGQRVLVGGACAARLALVLGGVVAGRAELDVLEALLTVADAGTGDPYAA